MTPRPPRSASMALECRPREAALALVGTSKDTAEDGAEGGAKGGAEGGVSVLPVHV